jgi:hypothetical protein
MLGVSLEDAIENGYVKDEMEWFHLFALFQQLHVSCERTAHCPWPLPFLVILGFR